MFAPLNVLGTPIQSCSQDPITGWFRDGCCNTSETDMGSHTVCCRLTDDFLEFLSEHGNDLATPAPEAGFAAVKEGDLRRVCAASWRLAYQQGKARSVVLESTHARALSISPLEEWMVHGTAEEV